MRLPRDWLGPREELVPIGPASRARARAAGLLGDEPLEDLPPTAHDFWGEDSAALHDAILGPTTADPRQPPVTAPAPARPAGRVPRFRPPHLRRPHVRRPQLCWPSGLTDLGQARRAWLLLPVPLIVAVVTVTAFAGGGSSSRSPGSQATHPSTSTAPSQSTKAAIATTPRPATTGRPSGEALGVTRVNRSALHRRARTRHARTRHPRSQLASPVRYVSRSSAPPAASPSPMTNPVTSANLGTTSAPTPTPTPTVTHSNSSAPATAASGSHTTSSTSTPPHFGSSGSLGPGTSPDS